MNTQACLSLSRFSDLPTAQPASGACEVRLRTSCVVEYAVRSDPEWKEDSGPSGGTTHEAGTVLLSVYVPHCMLNPDQVRIVEI